MIPARARNGLRGHTIEQDHPWDRPPYSGIPNRFGDREPGAIYAALGRAVSDWEGVSAATAALFHALLKEAERSDLEAGAVEAFGGVTKVQERAKRLRARWERFFDADFGAAGDDAEALLGELPELMAAYRGWAERRNDLAHGTVTEAAAPDVEQDDQPIVAHHALCPSHARTGKWPHVEPEYNYVAGEIAAFADAFRALNERIEGVAQRVEALRSSRTARARRAEAVALTVWGRRSAFNVQKVLWLVGELGLPHRHVSVGGDEGGLDAPEFLAMNPHERVPVVRDEEATVWESQAILRYLAAKHGGTALWSRGLARRSEWDRWMDWSQTEWQPAFMGLFWSFYRTPEAERDRAVIDRHAEACAVCVRKLDRALEGRPFLCGDAFSLGDISAGTALYRYHEIDVARPATPNVEAWYARLRERPAFREHVMRPFDEMRGKRSF